MDEQITFEINQLTEEHNRNNISRTKAYLRYYQNNPNIKWAFLASMVSRNAGWNMTDLQTKTYKQLLPEKMINYLFLTYERANWFIFSDAYPQLLMYQYSVKNNKPLFHLLNSFNISTFMIYEWMHFWEKEDQNRLLTALIINEQNLIQKPVILQPFYKQKVFHSLPYILQEKVHLNSVLFPTLDGKLYGLFIRKFTETTNRIDTGKTLASLLFHPKLYKEFLTFANCVEPTGNRKEYEEFLHNQYINSEELEKIFPIIKHENKVKVDWYKPEEFQRNWWKESHIEPKLIGDQFYKKRRLLRRIANWKDKIIN